MIKDKEEASSMQIDVKITDMEEFDEIVDMLTRSNETLSQDARTLALALNDMLKIAKKALDKIGVE